MMKLIKRNSFSILVDDLIDKYGIENIPKIMDKIKILDSNMQHSELLGVLMILIIPEGKRGL